QAAASAASAANAAKAKLESKILDLQKRLKAAEEENEVFKMKAGREKEAAKMKAEEEIQQATIKKSDEEAAMKKMFSEMEAKVKIPDEAALEKPPIKFKDAVGRNFTFPFYICRTWEGMEKLIKEAFTHVDIIGPHVYEGHYDLVSPDGEIILPSLWNATIQP
ncbi:hypothetical protein GQ53DRAFT_607746, partial [Thozetella sp. PMI_491]